LATKRIRDAIIDGEFALGEMIPEESLAQAMGVSRTPVREALNELQRLGLVTVKPQRGSYVFEPSEGDIAAICDYRCMLETQAARLAYAVNKVDALDALSTALEQMEQAQVKEDRVAYGHADTRFHESMFAFCGNPYLHAAYDLVAGKIAALRTQLTAPFENLRTQSLDEHRVFIKLFQKGDFAQYEALMREHVDRTREVYTKAWSSLREKQAGNNDTLRK
jgi:DNA-binding GntR family transcriptional regulator